MRKLIVAMAFLCCLQVATADVVGSDAKIGAAKAKACVACHNAMVSLKGKGADTIVEQMKAIRAGDKSHPPGLASLKDEDLAIIAAYLDSAN